MAFKRSYVSRNRFRRPYFRKRNPWTRTRKPIGSYVTKTIPIDMDLAEGPNIFVCNAIAADKRRYATSFYIKSVQIRGVAQFPHDESAKFAGVHMVYTQTLKLNNEDCDKTGDLFKVKQEKADAIFTTLFTAGGKGWLLEDGVNNKTILSKVTTIKESDEKAASKSYGEDLAIDRYYKFKYGQGSVSYGSDILIPENGLVVLALHVPHYTNLKGSIRVRYQV